uniref:RING finger protein 150 n=2 Tax=Schistocephalus solidus TaxID=70667 RepID=A0A0X3Q0B7_SCHSO
MISIGFDQCAVCIELFQPHDVIRSLPCKHFYHKACIDPWLLKHRSCPLCKQNILLACGIILEDGLSSSSNSSSESSTSSSTSASGNGRNAMGTMFGHFLPTAGEHMREGRLLWMNDSNICPPLFGFSCQQRSYMLCFCQRRQHGRPSPYRDNLHVLNSAGYNSMPASHPVHFRLNSVSNSSEYSISSFIQHCRTAEALARDTGHSAKMSTHRWYSKQQHLPGYIAAAATTSSSLSSSSSEKRNHYRYRADQRFPNRSVWRLSRLLSRRSRAWCLPWCFIRYSPVAPRSAAVASTPVCEPEKVEHTVTQSGPGNEKNSHTVCVHLLPYSRCHQPLSCYQHPPLPAVPAVDPRQRSAVAPDYTCCYSHFQPISTLAPDPMPCPGYYRACVHSHLPVEDFVVDVTSAVAKNAVDAISSQNNLQGKEEGQKMMLPAGDCLPSYDQVAEIGPRLVKVPSFEGSTTSGSDEIRPLSPPTPDIPAKRAMLLPALGTSCSLLPMIVKVDVFDQPLPPPPPSSQPPPSNPHCVSSPDLRPSPGAANALPIRSRCGYHPSAIGSMPDSSLPRDLPPPAYSEIVASPDVKFAPDSNRTAVCGRSGSGGDAGNTSRAPVASKPLKRAVRFFTHTLASIGFPTTTAAVSKPKSCSNVACSRQPHPSGRDCQRYLFPSSPSMYQSYAAHGHQRHSHHPYHRISRNSKSEAVAATTAVGFSRYHRNRRGGGAVWCTWRDSRVYSSHRLAKTIELEPTGIIKGFPKSSSSSGSMSSASSQQQKPAQETYPSSLLANSSPVRARFRNVKVTVEPQSQSHRRSELPAPEARGGRIPRAQSLLTCLLQPSDSVTFEVAAEHKKHSPTWVSVPNLHN